MGRLKRIQYADGDHEIWLMTHMTMSHARVALLQLLSASRPELQTQSRSQLGLHGALGLLLPLLAHGQPSIALRLPIKILLSKSRMPPCG